MPTQTPVNSECKMVVALFWTLLIFPFGWCFAAGMFLLPHYLEHTGSEILLARMGRGLSEAMGIGFRESVWIVLAIPLLCSQMLKPLLRKQVPK